LNHRDNPRENHFNLLRLLLAAGVVVSHCFILPGAYKQLEPWFWFTHAEHTLGTLCVEGFFIISGYLVSESFERAPYLRPYFAARGLRIYPAAIVCTLLVGLLLGPLVSASASAYFHGEGFRDFMVWATSFANLANKDVVIGVFPTNPVPDRLNAPLWTISWELLCYFILVPVGILLYRQPVRGVRSATLVALVLLSLAGAWQNATKALYTSGIAAGLVVFWGYFSLGIIFRRLQDRLPRHVGLTIAAALGFLVLSRIETRAPLLALVSPYLFAYALLNAATQLPRSWLAFNRIGDFSYGTYLWGWPTQQTIVFLLPGMLNPFTLFLLAMPATLAIAALSWKFIERPALNLKARLRRSAGRTAADPRATATASAASR